MKPTKAEIEQHKLCMAEYEDKTPIDLDDLKMNNWYAAIHRQGHGVVYWCIVKEKDRGISEYVLGDYTTISSLESQDKPTIGKLVRGAFNHALYSFYELEDIEDRIALLTLANL